MPRSSSTPQRHSNRMEGYDYSQPGAYFVTLVTQDRQCLFGEVKGDAIQLSRFGYIVRNTIIDLPKHYPHLRLGAFCIMPNHVHAIFVLVDEEKGGSQPVDISSSPPGETLTSTQHSLSEIVRALKSFSARQINSIRNTPDVPVWQRSYYDRILRNEDEWGRAHAYILDNPRQWSEDRENPLLSP
jgi:putative transposase